MALHVSVIYYSATGTNALMAAAARDAAAASGAEVRLRRVPELAPPEAIARNPAWQSHLEKTRHVEVATLDDLDWGDVLVFSAPTRFGNLAAQMKQFFDTAGPLWGQGKLTNKVVTAMSSAQNPHGGQEATVLAMYTTMHHWGAIIVSPGYTDPVYIAAGGNPYGTTTVSVQGDTLPEAIETAVKAQTLRAITVATWLKKGQGERTGA